MTDFDDPECEVGDIIPFTRIEPVEGSGETTPRAYENENTSLLDASMIYGSDAATEASLRDGAYLRVAETDDLLGETFSTVFVGQFERIRNADPDRAESTTSLSYEEFDTLWSTTLSDIIQNNSRIEYLQEDAFIAYDRFCRQ